MSEPKTIARRIALRVHNRKSPRRRINLPAEQIVYTNPDFLSQFTTPTGRILPRRVTRVSAKVHRHITREIKRARAVNLLK